MDNAEKERIQKDFFASGDANAVLDARTKLVDRLVAENYGRTLAGREGIALLAVGGYGRRELFPYSDIDLLFLTEDERRQDIKEPLSAMLQCLWDAGLRVSQSVHTADECADLHEDNIELNVSLLDRRFLTGDRQTDHKLSAKYERFLPAHRDDLNRHLSRMTRERHAKAQDTLYHLEPNIKEAPGGMRDFQVIRWAERISGKARETGDLAKPAGELFALRCYLHYLSGRDNNVLNFDLQEQVAERRGSEPAALMRDYFRQAKQIRQACLHVLDQLETRRSPLFTQFRDRLARLSNSDFTVSRDRIFFRAPALLPSDPLLTVRLFVFMARHGVRLAPDTEQRIAANCAPLEEYFGQPRPIWPALHEMLGLPHAALALRAMQDTGLLRAIFPELRDIESLVIRDFYHRYTVDEHTLVAIQTVLQLRGKPDNPFAELIAELDDIALLLVALIFHDAGKGSPDEGHVDASVRVARPALSRIGVPEEDWRTIEFLIAAHLEMSSVMNSRDLSDPATSDYMARRVGTVERLKLLTLLTYGDISAVNPNAMTPWRSGLLWRLYAITYQALTRGLDTERIQPEAEDSPERAAFLEGLPARYLRTHSSREIDDHVRMERESQARGVAIELNKSGSVYVMTVVSQDRPYLFAACAGAISSFGMNILKAEAFANRHGTFLVTITFEDPLRSLELNPSELDHIRGAAKKAVLKQVEVSELLKRRPKFVAPSKRARVAPKVSIDDKTSETATLIQIVAEDRPGLLYGVASAISALGCNIEVVLIDTESHKAIDVFYVTEDGAKPSPEKSERLCEKLMEVCTG